MKSLIKQTKQNSIWQNNKVRLNFMKKLKNLKFFKYIKIFFIYFKIVLLINSKKDQVQVK